MKTNTFNIRKLGIFSFLVSIIFSCSTIKELEYNVPQNPLHMKGGDVTLQFNGKFVEKGINPKGIVFKSDSKNEIILTTCDSIVTLNLTINSSEVNSEVVTS